MAANRLLVLGLAMLAGGCGGSNGEPAAARDGLTAELGGVYTGTFPCADCDGLDAALWLRADGTFFSRQRHPDTAGGETAGYNLGRWRYDAETRELGLLGAGPERRFTLDGNGRLTLVTASPLEHVLRRDAAAAPDFTDTIPIEGVAAVDGARIELSECLTGLTAVLDGGADYTRLRRRLHSAVGTRGSALVELEGRYTWTPPDAPAALAVERFHAIVPGDACAVEE